MDKKESVDWSKKARRENKGRGGKERKKSKQTHATGSGSYMQPVNGRGKGDRM